MEANKILNADVLDILFEGKNKEYGAYDLRKTYNRRLKTAGFITIGVGLLIFLISFLANAFHSNSDKDFEVKDLSLSQIKKEDKPLPPPPPKPKLPPPPKIETIKFTPPKVVKDEEVPKDEKPPEVDKIDAKIDVKSDTGVNNGIVQPAVQDQGTQVVEQVDDNKIFEKVEKEAEFPGGEAQWRRYLEKNLNANVPIDNGAPEGTYTVIVKFIVSKDGSISDVQAETNFGYGMEDEAVKQIKRGPKWTPALQNGRNVNAYRRQPITFVVQEQ
jgi:protein TonB